MLKKSKNFNQFFGSSSTVGEKVRVRVQILKRNISLKLYKI